MLKDFLSGKHVGYLQEGGMLVHLEMGCTENTNIICIV